MGILGHRNINTTYRYVRLYNQIYKHQQSFKFLTKVASTKEERCDLINDGWDLVEKDVFKGLTRDGKPISKTFSGNKEDLLLEALVPPLA